MSDLPLLPDFAASVPFFVAMETAKANLSFQDFFLDYAGVQGERVPLLLSSESTFAMAKNGDVLQALIDCAGGFGSGAEESVFHGKCQEDALAALIIPKEVSSDLLQVYSLSLQNVACLFHQSSNISNIPLSQRVRIPSKDGVDIDKWPILILPSLESQYGPQQCPYHMTQLLQVASEPTVKFCWGGEQIAKIVIFVSSLQPISGAIEVVVHSEKTVLSLTPFQKSQVESLWG